MPDLYLIRHGKTPGNELKRYIGTTDESLSESGKQELKGKVYPEVDMLFVSPMKRCRETGEILFPNMEQYVVEDLKECAFGDFENKNYIELKDNPDYQRWIDSYGTIPFPNGESREAFIHRTLIAFDEVMDICRKSEIKRAALVVHGGSIMAIMEQYGLPKKGYYDWQMANGCGINVTVDFVNWAEHKELIVKRIINE